MVIFSFGVEELETTYLLSKGCLLLKDICDKNEYNIKATFY